MGRALVDASRRLHDAQYRASHDALTGLANRTLFNEILASHTGKTNEEIGKACDRDYYMTALEAKAFGLVDDILTKPPGSEEAEEE